MKIYLKNFKKVNEIKTTTLIKFLTKEYIENFIKKNGKCICGPKCKCGSKCDCQKYPIQEAVYEYNFSGKLFEIVLAGFNIPNKKNKVDKVILVGLGSEKELNNIDMEKVGFKTFQYLKIHKIKNVTCLFNLEVNKDSFKFTEKINNKNVKDLYSHLIFGFELGEYNFSKYFTGSKIKKINLEEVNFIVDNVKNYEKELKDFDLIKENIFYCRDLINEPANIVNPEYMVQEAKKLSKLNVKVTILKVKDMLKLGMESLLAVGQGSDKESQMVLLEYNGSTKKNKPLAFVGKGVCFDSGGLSLKPSSAMDTMKCDMSGSAVVLSLIKLLATRKAKINVIGVMPLVENMPSGKATKVGDIIKSMSGQTIEIINTDAEGRMILADALYYVASKYNPELIIDLATLTGAICVALGEKYAGLFSNNDNLSEELKNSGINTGEYVWRMPLSKINGYYDKLIDSEFADVRNTGKTRDAGSITAGQFLQRFINNHKKWAHIDIAGTAYVNQEGFLTKKFATGYGVRLLNELIKTYYEK